MGSRMRINRSATGNRRSHHKAATPRLSKDKKGGLHLRHRVSPTGEYRNRSVLDVAGKEERKALKKEKQAQLAETEEVVDEVAETQSGEAPKSTTPKTDEPLDPTMLSKSS